MKLIDKDYLITQFSNFLDKITDTFADKIHKHNVSDINNFEDSVENMIDNNTMSVLYDKDKNVTLKTMLDKIPSDADKNNWNNKVDKKTNYDLVSKTDIAQISTNKSDIEILKGNGEGSIDALINTKINEWASQLTDDGTVNTYAEALNWIATHASDYTALLGDVANKVDKKMVTVYLKMTLLTH